MLRTSEYKLINNIFLLQILERVGDVRVPVIVDRFRDSVMEKFGQIDILVSSHTFIKLEKN